MRSPILGADVVCYAKNHWMRIIDDVALRDGSDCRAVVYYYCDIFQAINLYKGLVVVVFQME